MDHFIHEQALVSKKARIGSNTRIWAFSNVLDDVVIGENCNICDGCFLENGVRIGNNVTIKNNVAVFEGINIADNVFIGANVSFINDRRPRSHNEGNWKLEETTIMEGATIGAGATVLCGLTIGKFALVGAGAVLTKNVAPYSLWFGNPAVKQGYVCACGQKLDDTLKCSCGKTFVYDGEGLKLDE